MSPYSIPTTTNSATYNFNTPCKHIVRRIEAFPEEIEKIKKEWVKKGYRLVQQHKPRKTGDPERPIILLVFDKFVE